MKRPTLLALSLAASLLGCGAPQDRASPQGPPARATHGTFAREGSIGTYTSTPWGFSTSSYVLEGPSGLIAIDTQFLPSATEELIELAESATKKKFVLAVVLHANPDKFNGTATFQRRGVRVVTSAQVQALVAGVHEKRLEAFYDRYQP